MPTAGIRIVEVPRCYLLPRSKQRYDVADSWIYESDLAGHALGLLTLVRAMYVALLESHLTAFAFDPPAVSVQQDPTPVGVVALLK